MENENIKEISDSIIESTFVAENNLLENSTENCQPSNRSMTGNTNPDPSPEENSETSEDDDEEWQKYEEKWKKYLKDSSVFEQPLKLSEPNEESKYLINIQKKNNNENESISETLNSRELRVKVIDFSFCHCSLDRPISTHFCEDCTEGFCFSCVKAHERFKVTRKHYIQKINYFCKCKTKEKLLAAKFCKECSEFFCTYCISAHQRLIVTKKHKLKSIFQIGIINEIKTEPEEETIDIIDIEVSSGDEAEA